MRSMRPVCGSCSEEIVGVVPAWKDGMPVCRNCAFGGPAKRSGKGADAPVNPGGRSRRKSPVSRVRLPVAVFVILAAVFAAAIEAGEIAVALKAESPGYRGAQGLDRETEACISNLWKVTVLLQNDARSWPVLRCPSTGQPYNLTHTRGDSTAACPNPAKHGVRDIRVSRSAPVPEVTL